MYKSFWKFHSAPAEGKIRAYINALWSGVAACAFFTAYAGYINYRMSSIEGYLVSHSTQTVQASVTRVFSQSHWLTKHPWCAIFVEASFMDPISGRKFSLTGPDHYGFLGSQIEWSDCDDRYGPIDYGRKLAVGDHVPAVYAIVDPNINRPGWIDYSFRLHRGWLACWVALSMTVLLTVVTTTYGRIAGSKARRWRQGF